MCGRDLTAAVVTSGLLLGAAVVAVLMAVRQPPRGHGQHALGRASEGRSTDAAGAAWPLVRPGCSCAHACDHADVSGRRAQAGVR